MEQTIQLVIYFKTLDGEDTKTIGWVKGTAYQVQKNSVLQ